MTSQPTWRLMSNPLSLIRLPFKSLLNLLASALSCHRSEQMTSLSLSLSLGCSQSWCKETTLNNRGVYMTQGLDEKDVENVTVQTE